VKEPSWICHIDAPLPSRPIVHIPVILEALVISAAPLHKKLTLLFVDAHDHDGALCLKPGGFCGSSTQNKRFLEKGLAPENGAVLVFCLLLYCIGEAGYSYRFIFFSSEIGVCVELHDFLPGFLLE
jgi:hypothetical protein